MPEKDENNKNQKPHVISIKHIPFEEQGAYEIERIRKAILMSDMEKFRLFCRMLRIGIMFKNAIITHKKEWVENDLKTPPDSPE
ncbi:hypothetical protein PDL71_16850 [Lacibacter sp. MH-610]|uniref:hypothetical protein n=1 Tax=Lacibacter sp. MH-610 TaxID=3020883 RepID=UPI0038926402